MSCLCMNEKLSGTVLASAQECWVYVVTLLFMWFWKLSSMLHVSRFAQRARVSRHILIPNTTKCQLYAIQMSSFSITQTTIIIYKICYSFIFNNTKDLCVATWYNFFNDLQTACASPLLGIKTCLICPDSYTLPLASKTQSHRPGSKGGLDMVTFP